MLDPRRRLLDRTDTSHARDAASQGAQSELRPISRHAMARTPAAPASTHVLPMGVQPLVSLALDAGDVVPRVAGHHSLNDALRRRLARSRAHFAPKLRTDSASDVDVAVEERTAIGGYRRLMTELFGDAAVVRTAPASILRSRGVARSHTRGALQLVVDERESS